MALIYRYRTFNDGVEFPVKETISKVMLCTMFDQDLDQSVHIFFDSERVATLEVTESYFRPEKHGKYIAVFEKAEKETMTNLLLASVTKHLVTAKYYENENLEAKISRFYPLQSTKSDFATLYMHGFSENKIAVPINTDITKELLCSMFEKPLDLKIKVYYQGDKLLTFGKDDMNKSFVTDKPGFYRINFSLKKKKPKELECSEFLKNEDQKAVEEESMILYDLFSDEPCSSNQKTPETEKGRQDEDDSDESDEDDLPRKKSDSNDWEIVGSEGSGQAK